MISIQSIQQMMQHIRDDPKKELAPIIEIFPEFEKVVLKNLLWGAFFKQNILNTKSDFAFSFDYLEEVKEKLKEEAPSFKHHFFNPQIEEKVKGKFITVNLKDNDDLECSVVMSDADGSYKYESDVTVVVALTLPDSSIVFESLKKQSDLDPYDKWLYEYMDMYDAWRHKVMDKLYHYYIQVGGHGRWIQDSYNDTYVAQINAEIGDSGSIFVYIEDGKAKAQVDMF